jgi:hypothetical protein
MGDVVGFIPRSERERIRMIREARAIYDSIFPSADSVTEKSEGTPTGHAINPVNAYRGNGGRS